jgi:hypothetical protein
LSLLLISSGEYASIIHSHGLVSQLGVSGYGKVVIRRKY